MNNSVEVALPSLPSHRLHSSRLIGVSLRRPSRRRTPLLLSLCGTLWSATLAVPTPTRAQESAPASVPAAADGTLNQVAEDGTILLPLNSVSRLPLEPNATFTYDSVQIQPRVNRTEKGNFLDVTARRPGRAGLIITKANGSKTSYVFDVLNADGQRLPYVSAPTAATISVTAPTGASPTDIQASVPTATTNDAPNPIAAPRPERANAPRPTAPAAEKTAPSPSPRNAELTTQSVVPMPAQDASMLAPTLPPLKKNASLPSGLGAPDFSGMEMTQQTLPPSDNANRFPAPNATQIRGMAQTSANGGQSGRTITVTRGLARFLKFSENILSVYYSDVDVMDARAMNARTVAISGTQAGRSTLAVFVAQNPNDVVGRAEIFNIVVEAPTPKDVPIVQGDPAAIEMAIRSALSDPRIAVSVIQQPNGGFAAKLSGILRDAAEVSAAISTAALFVPRDQVISSLYLDPTSPTLQQINNPVQMATGEEVLQSKLRQITGNDTVELVSLPTGLAAKATVTSREDAQALMGLLGSLNQRILPFIVVRDPNNANANNGDNGEPSKYYGSDRPVLQGEDQRITDRLQEVTGVKTVYAVRTASNAVAVYGTVRNRIEYDTVRRYAAVMIPALSITGQQQGGVVQSAPTTNPATYGAPSGLAPNPNVPAAANNAAGNTGAGNTVGNGLYVPMANARGNAPQYQFNAQVAAGAANGTGFGGGATGVSPNIGGTDATGATALPAPANETGLPTGLGGVGFGNPTLGANGLPVTAGSLPFATPTGGVYSPYGFGAAGPGSVPFAPYPVAGLGGVQASGFISDPEHLTSPINAAQQPAAGYRQPINVQMFVRVLDGVGQQVRRVTAETAIVEISRTSLRNLGIEVGSAALLSRTETPGTAPTVNINPTTGQPTTVTPGTPGVTNSTVDPAFRTGVIVGGNGFSGQGPLQLLDPLRARLNALYQNGNARILSKPNLTATEGAEAQIVIGGERPVPSAVATGQAVGQSIVFRRFGIILTMRPTLTDDDTIILQIRADVTELANEFGITLNGALIPGERVRSVNTTMNMREGDTIVLGGLITNDRRLQTSRVPILSSLPFIGSLFKSKRFENNESELAIFLTPRILRSDASVNTMETVKRVPGLPGLPDPATGAAAFGVLGTAAQQ